MARSKLKHYLKMHRRLRGLSQEEMAYLLGCKSPAKVSRYENCDRLPTLKTVLAYEYIFKVPVTELFAGIYQEVEKEVPKRAAQLYSKLQNAQPNRKAKRKMEFLRVVAVAPEIKKENL
jgi:transcriptional regulator with XRE-family HTH domain